MPEPPGDRGSKRGWPVGLEDRQKRRDVADGVVVPSGLGFALVVSADDSPSHVVPALAHQPGAPQIGSPPSAIVNADGFDNKPFEQNFLDRFGSFSDGQFSHAPVGTTVPGPAAILTAGVGLLMMGGRRRPL